MSQIINIKNQVVYYFKKYGFIKTIKKICYKIYEIIFKKGNLNFETVAYDTWIALNDPTEEEINRERNYKFKINPKISILVPLYNTPIIFFEELVDYLINQTYTNWELCLADGSLERNKEIERIVHKDDRIKYNFVGKNLGIAENTNEALKMATGDYIGLLDHDDLIPINALFEVVNVINEDPSVEFIYTDEDKITTTDKPRFDPNFKPDFAIDTLRAVNYICHFSVFRKDLMEKLGGERSKYNGAQDYDLIIRMAEIAKNIKHIPKILYHWRVHELSTANADVDAKPYAFEAGILVLQDHLKRVGLEGVVTHGLTRGTYRIDYNVKDNAKVTILIPNRNEKETLKKCIDSILDKTTYENYEIVVIENNSTEEIVFDYYKKLEENEKVKVLYYKDEGFNYSKLINFGVRNTDGKYIVQLNNDTEILTENWLEQMISFCQRDDIGCVGVKLYYPDDTIQHAGVIIGIGGVAGHPFKCYGRYEYGYYTRASLIQDMSAVTAACMMSKRSIYEEVEYMNEEFAVAFNDIDFCLRVRKLGYLIVYNPFVELYHYESKTRGYEDTIEKQKRFAGEINTFKKYWSEFLNKGDPYYNVNLSLNNENYEIKKEKIDYK